MLDCFYCEKKLHCVINKNCAFCWFKKCVMERRVYILSSLYNTLLYISKVYWSRDNDASVTFRMTISCRSQCSLIITSEGICCVDWVSCFEINSHSDN
jgi:hypothetical protein